VGLPDTATIVTVEPWDIDHEFDLVMPDWKHFEDPGLLTEPDNLARSTTRTLQGVGMSFAIEDRLVQKTTFLYCTPGTPNV